MQRIIIILIISSVVLSMLLFSCKDNKSIQAGMVTRTVILSADTALHLVNGILYYHSNPLSGDVKELYPNGITRSIQSIKDGKQQGLSETFYENGKRESTRWYVKGEKDSVHTGWWENGNRKYEYHFINGSYNGMFIEWYQSGKMLQQVMYAQGNEISGKGWRESGKLYMNFIMKNGRRYGLNNSNLCYTLDKETVKQK